MPLRERSREISLISESLTQRPLLLPEMGCLAKDHQRMVSWFLPSPPTIPLGKDHKSYFITCRVFCLFLR